MYKGRLTVDKAELLAGIRAVQPAFETRQAILAPFREWPRIPSEVDAQRIAEGAREVTAALGAEGVPGGSARVRQRRRRSATSRT